MRSPRPLYFSLLSVLLTVFALAIPIRAADDEEGDDYDVKSRVVRISLLQGEVSLKRNGTDDWEQARLNVPLSEGDTLATGRDARVELQLDARNFIRIDAVSVLRLTTLRDEGVAMSLVEGTISLRLANFDAEKEYFEIDAPGSTLAVESAGTFRIDAPRDGRVRLTARDGGKARIYSGTSGFTLRSGRSAELIADGAEQGDWELAAASDLDTWDVWVSNRERYLAQRFRYDTQYYDRYLWGGEDLNSYGNWTYTSDYGWLWQPHITVINNYNDWAPYRYGNWVWLPAYGWTWVGYEPWGWAPYHYGRWVYYNNYWAWCPRSHYHRNRSWWRPALVAFHISYGNEVCWYPLSYHQRDPHSRHYRNNDRDPLTPLRSAEVRDLRRVNPAYLRAVTALPLKDFGAGGARLQPAPDTVARQAIAAEPLRGDLPVRPAYTRNPGTTDGTTVTVARPARVAPAVEILDRPTGAAERRNATALDRELRRERIFNNREPRPATIVENPGINEPRPTGAVARPERPRSEGVPTGRRRNPEGVGEQTNPTIPPAPDGGAQVSPRNWERNDANDRRGPGTPRRPTSNEAGSASDRPAQPAQSEPPEAAEPPARRDKRDAVPLRPQPAERRAEPRTEEPSRRYEPPPQRSEPPQRTAPPERRYEPPPQRSEPPQPSEAPRRSDPPPQRAEPAKVEREAPARVPRPKEDPDQ